MSPSSFAASSVTAPDSTSTRWRRPSWEAAASFVPSGAGPSGRLVPRSGAVIVVAATADSGSTSATWMASPPPASVTQATLPVVPRMRGSRARAAGLTDRARAGPSACVSQCSVPRTSTTLAAPVSSGSRSPRWSAAVITRGTRAAGGALSWTSSLRGCASAARLSSRQISPATW